jgi:hypothetical protein
MTNIILLLTDLNMMLSSKKVMTDFFISRMFYSILCNYSYQNKLFYQGKNEL